MSKRERRRGIRPIRLPIYRRESVTKKVPGGFTRELETLLYETTMVTPYGRDLALLSKASGQLPSGIWLDVKVRNGRPQCVAIRSEPGDPEITSELLRFPLAAAVDALIRLNTVRLETDEDGNPRGMMLSGPAFRIDRRTLAERTADVDAALRRRGRKPLSDDFLRDVAEIVLEARAERKPVDKELVNRLGPAKFATARQWVSKARARGFLPPAQTRRRRNADREEQ